MEIMPINAADLLQEPDQSALRLIHTQLENSQEPGQALFFARENPRIRRPDFLIGLEGRAYFALQVATEPHGVSDGKLVLVPAVAGVKPALSQVGYASARAVGVSKDVHKHLDYRIYVIPVAVFVGHDPDNAVQAWAIDHDVRILFSTDQLVERLVVIANEYADQIYIPPTLTEIREVMGVLKSTDLPRRDTAPASSPSARAELDLTAHQVIIQHADTVNIYTTEPGEGGSETAFISGKGGEA